MGTTGSARAFLTLLACLFLVPLAAWVATRGEPSDVFQLIAPAAGAIAVLGWLLLLVMYGGPVLTGQDRTRMSFVFGPWLRAVMLLIGLSMLAQTALFAYTFVMVEREHSGSLQVSVVIALVCVAGLYAFVTLTKASISFFQSRPLTVKGALLTRAEQPRLYELVEGLARKLRAQPPDQIVLGAEPTFFVTSSEVRLWGSEKMLRGRTLYVSASLMRVLDAAQFAAVLGHELGHFRSEDVAYSMRFAPTYARFGRTMRALAASSGYQVIDLAKWPAVVMLHACMARFVTLERTVGREREMLADQAGVEATDKHAFAHALVKTTLAGPLWGDLTQANVKLLADGKALSHLPSTFADGFSRLVQALDWQAVCGRLGDQVLPHPVDSHPPLAQRLAAVGVPLESVAQSECSVGPASACEVLDDASKLEERLSEVEARWLVSVGAASPPKEGNDAKARGEAATD